MTAHTMNRRGEQCVATVVRCLSAVAVVVSLGVAPVHAQGTPAVRAGVFNPSSATIVVKAKPTTNAQGYLSAVSIALRWPTSSQATVRVTSSPLSIARQDSGTDGAYKWVSFGVVNSGTGINWTANTEFELFTADLIGHSAATLVELTTSPSGKADWYVEEGPTLGDLANRADGSTPFYQQSVTVYPPFTRISTFTGRYVPASSQVVLDWATANEINNKGFEVQKSLDPTKDFVTLPNSFIQGHGTTTNPQVYSFTDGAPAPGAWYYRLKQIDLDNTERYNDPIVPDGLASIPLTPVLLTPAHNSTGQPVNLLLLSWQAAGLATRYHLQLATDSTFAGASLVKNDTAIQTTSREISGLSNSTRYYWRVRGANDSGVGLFSSTWSFTTLIPLPGPVTLLSPANATTVGQDSIRFRWTRTSPASLTYWIEVSPDSTFGPFTYSDSTLKDTTFLFKPLVNNRTYYWRVRGGNGGGWGAAAPIRRFNVIITDVAQEDALPKDFGLQQNYPNPFNPTTVISFQLPVASQVNLVVYDMLGREVATLVDGTQPAGRHRVEFSATGLASGVYLYRLRAGEYVEARKMALTR